MDKIKAWLFWRLPRLWMNGTAYAFWVMEQRQLLQRRVRAEALASSGRTHADATNHNPTIQKD